MTPSTSLTLGGFLQGLQADLMGLIAALVIISVVIGVIHYFIRNAAKDSSDKELANDFLKWVDRIGLLVIVLTVIGFGIHAAVYATNSIPRSDLDKSGVYEQMDSNIKK